MYLKRGTAVLCYAIEKIYETTGMFVHAKTERYVSRFMDCTMILWENERSVCRASTCENMTEVLLALVCGYDK
jgi:hypothetical protein